MTEIQNYQEFMTPCLNAFYSNNCQEKSISKIEEIVCKNLMISLEEKTQLLPSGRKTVVSSRIGWAIFYMYKAGLLERVRHGLYKITEEGKNVIQSGAIISSKYLEKYHPFRKFKNTKMVELGTTAEEVAPNAEDPITIINTAVEEINKKVLDELLDCLEKANPFYFEKIILDVMIAMGYGGARNDSAKVTPKSNDGGIDGVIDEDVLGFDKIYLQAKRYSRNTKVSRPDLQKFFGALAGQRAKKGIFITTGLFSDEAIKEAEKLNIITIDGKRLSEIMLKYGVGVIQKDKIEIKTQCATF
jgi:restriction system protein